MHQFKVGLHSSLFHFRKIVFDLKIFNELVFLNLSACCDVSKIVSQTK